MRDLKKLIAEFADQITSDWIEYFVQGAKIKHVLSLKSFNHGTKRSKIHKRLQA